MGAEDLISLVRRGPALRALSREPMDRRDLQERLDVSRPTIHRLTRALEEGALIERIDGEVALTALGETVAEALESFEREVSAARRLAPVLEAARDLDVDFEVDHFADATVTRAEPGNPYAPVTRFMALVGETGTLRGLDPASINPLHVDEIHRRIVAGMETDAIYHPAVAADVLETNPERARTAFESGNLTLRTHEDLPFGLTLCDDRIGIGVYDDQNGMLELYVDTDAPGARAWAEEVYASFLASADRLDPPADASPSS